MPFVAPAALTFGGALIAGAGVSAAITLAAITGGISFVSQKIAENDLDDLRSSLASRSRLLSSNRVSNVVSIPVIYGETRIAPVRVFARTTLVDNLRLDMALVFCEGGHADAPNSDMIEVIDEIKVDDDFLGDAKYSGYQTVERFYGADNQMASALLINPANADEWGSAHRLRGVAYLATQFTQPSPGSGIESPWLRFPVITARVQGRKVYDMRDAGQLQNDPSTWAYSQNPALCILDYLRSKRYGNGLADEELDFASFESAADYCDELITHPDGAGGTVSVPRYRLNGIVDTGNPIVNNVRSLLTSCRGILIWTTGVYKLKIDRPESAVRAFDESHIVGNWDISLGARANRVNLIRAYFTNPDRGYQSDMAIATDAALKTQDNDDALEQDIDLPFTQDIYTAREIAEITLKQSRDQITARFIGTTEWLEVEPGDVVEITHELPGWSSKLFRVVNLGLTAEADVNVLVAEYDANNYDTTTLVDDDIADNTDLPDPTIVPVPTNVTVTPFSTIQDDGSVIASLRVTWTLPDDIFLLSAEIAWRHSLEPDWSSAIASRGVEQYIISPVAAGTDYDVRVRLVNAYGFRSAWVTVTNTTATGDSTPPGPVTNIAASGDVAAINLTWDNPTDKDFSNVEIWSSASSSFGAGSRLTQINAEAFRDPLPAGTTQYYWFRAYDRSGNGSTWNPSTGGPGISATALSGSGFDDDAFFNEIKPILQFSWRMGFEDREWEATEWAASANTFISQGTGTFDTGTKCGYVGTSGGVIGAAVWRKFTADEIAVMRGRRVSILYAIRNWSTSQSYRVGLYDATNGQWLGYIEESTPGSWTRKQILTGPAYGGAFNGLIQYNCTDLRFYIYPDRTDGVGQIVIDTVSVTAISNIIDAANITDYMAVAAITEAYIGDAQISRAKIQNAAVDTLKVDGDAITVPRSVFVPGAVTASATQTWYRICTAPSIFIPTEAAGQPVLLTFNTSIIATLGTGVSVRFRFLDNGVVFWEFGYFVPHVSNPPYTFAVNRISTAGANHVYAMDFYKSSSTINITAYQSTLTATLVKR